MEIYVIRFNRKILSTHMKMLILFKALEKIEKKIIKYKAIRNFEFNLPHSFLATYHKTSLNIIVPCEQK